LVPFDIAKTLALMVLTALAEILGCCLPWLWLKKSAPAWVLLPAAASLALFAWLLTLHPQLPAGSMRPMAASTSRWRWGGGGRWRACGRRAGTCSARPSRWPAWPSSCSRLRVDGA
jgi:hypothetical protein